MLDRDFFLSNPEPTFFTGVLHFVLVLLSAFFAFFTVNCSFPDDLLAMFSHNFRATNNDQQSSLENKQN